jgi:hypothetical protein
MCKHNEESIDHLLLHCEVAIEVWNMVLQLFGVTWVMLGRMKERLGSWRGQRGNRTILQIWRMFHLCVMWCLLRERNAQSFEDCELRLIKLKKMVLQTLYSWRVMWHLSQASMLAEFLDLCALFSA